MNTIRFALIRFLVRLIDLLSTNKADPADLAFCYRLLLGRRPDSVGWQLHMDFIRPGRARSVLVESFLNCTEYQMYHGRSTIELVDTGRFIMAVDNQDPHIAPAILHGQTYEPHVTAALINVLPPDGVFVDLGANMGWFTLTAASIARRGQVIAVEPNFNNVQMLYRSLIANGFDNVRVLPYAVSDKPAKLRLNYFRSNGYVSPVESENGTTSIVEAYPLDALLPQLERVDVLKIDIEGHEPIALRGMTATLDRYRPILLCEFHPAMIRAHSGVEPETFLNSLAAFGYGLAAIRADGSLTPELDTPGIIGEWERMNQETGSGGEMHLDLIGRPRAIGTTA